MLDVVKYCSVGFIAAILNFSAGAFSWNPREWFEPEKKVVATLAPIPLVQPTQPTHPVKAFVTMTFFEEQLQKFQKSSYYQYYTQAQKLAHQGSQEAYQKSIELLNYIKQHPLETSTAAFVAVGVYLLHRMSILREHVQHNKAWALWQEEETTVVRRSAMPVTADLLLHEIQVRYFDVERIADFIGPVQQFVVDIDSEAAQLEAYAWYARKLKRIGLRRFIDMNLYNEIDQRIKRLHDLKELCMQWLSKAKLGLLCV